MSLTLVVDEHPTEFAPPLREKLQGIEAEITSAEGNGLQARWDFGRAMLALRRGAKLSPGDLDKACAAVGASRAEIQRRIQFAAKFPTKVALSHAVRQWPTWHAMVSEGLPTKREKPTPKTSPARLALRRAADLVGEIHAADLEEADLRAIDTIIAELTRIKAEQAEAEQAAEGETRVA